MSPDQATTGIPIGAMTVQTNNSTYTFGPADKNGVRTISRFGNPLPISRCRIHFLLKGKSMIFESADPKVNNRWNTTEVQSIIVG